MTLRDALKDHMPALRRYAHALCGNAADAEDLFQDSLERALANEQSWCGTNLKAWLFTLMTNQHRSMLRARKSRPSGAPLADAEHLPSRESPSDPHERDRIVKALGLISEEGRATLLLVVLEGYSYAEVANILDVPIGTIMSRLSRARRQLSEILKGDNILPMRSRR